MRTDKELHDSIDYFDTTNTADTVSFQDVDVCPEIYCNCSDASDKVHCLSMHPTSTECVFGTDISHAIYTGNVFIPYISSFPRHAYH